MVIVVAFVALAVHLYHSQDIRYRRNYMLIFALGFLPVILLFTLSMPPVRPSFIDRYLVPATMGISLFIGVTLAQSSKILKPLWRNSLILLIAGAMIFGISSVYQLGNYNKTLHTSNNTRQTIEAITAKAHNGEPIIAASGWLFYEAVFYSTPNHPVYFINATADYRFGALDMLRYNDQYKIKDLGAFARANPIVWYLGHPGNSSLPPPSSQWKPLQQVEVNDSVSDQPSYRAIQYQTN
jgi:hypothetical protein